MKVTAILKGTADAHGKKKVYIRTNIGKIRRFKATKIKILPSQWDAENMKVKAAHPQANHFNQAIKKLLLENELAEVNGDRNFPEMDFNKYCEHCFLMWRSSKEDSTLINYGCDQRKITSYRPGLKLSEITPRFLELYKKHLSDNGDAHNTIWRAFRFIRTVILKAINDNLIKDNPFNRFEMPQYINPKTFYLTMTEIKKIEDYSIDPATPKHLAFLSKWFIISCYTGLRYKDMYLFCKEDHIKDNRFVLYTDKTGSIVSIKLSDKLKELLKRVDYKPLNWQNQPSNRELKTIQRACEIKTKLKWHVARHTFGVRCADAGLSIEVTSKLMGHTNTTTTSIYYKITNKRLDKEVELIFN